MKFGLNISIHLIKYKNPIEGGAQSPFEVIIGQSQKITALINYIRGMWIHLIEYNISVILYRSKVI